MEVRQEMWVSKNEWVAIHKKISDLEAQVQSQKMILLKHINDHKQENEELCNILQNIKDEIYKGMQQIL